MRTKRIVVMVVLAILGLAVIRLSDVLPIIGMAIILAYLISPLVNFIENRVLVFGRFGRSSHRNLAVIITYVLIVATFIIVVLVVVPVLVRPTDWETGPFGGCAPLPSNRKPVTRWDDRDEAWPRERELGHAPSELSLPEDHA